MDKNIIAKTYKSIKILACVFQCFLRLIGIPVHANFENMKNLATAFYLVSFKYVFE
jgi:hypothetical protein